METCATCRLELEGNACPRCSPPVDAATFDDLEATPLWTTAQRHEVASRGARSLLLVTAIFGTCAAAVWAATSDGDISLAVQVLFGFFALGALGSLIGWFIVRRMPVERHAAVVLTRVISRSLDSKGRTSTNYFLTIATRRGNLRLAADHDKIASLSPGDPVIAFGRWGHLDAVWPAPIEPRLRTAAPSPEIAAIAPAATTYATALEAAKARLAAVDPAAIERANATPYVRPWRTCVSTAILGWIAVGVFALAVTPLATTVDNGAPDGEGDAQSLRIIGFILGGIGIGILAACVRAVVRARRNVDRRLVVVLRSYTNKLYVTPIPMLEVVLATGTVTSLQTNRALASSVPIGVAVIAITADTLLLQTLAVPTAL